MSNLVNGNYGVNNGVSFKASATAPKNISYRGSSDFERTPDNDSFESEDKNNTGKVLGITAGVLATAVLVVGGICLHKGGKALGEEAKFGEKIKKGWEELWHKGEKALDEETKNVTDKAGDAAGKNGKNAETAVEKQEEGLVNIGEEVNPGPDGNDLYKQIIEAQPLTESEIVTKNAEEEARLAAEKVKNEAAEKARIEAEQEAKRLEKEKAAKLANEAKDKAIREKLEQEKILPEAREIIQDGQNIWNKEVGRCTRLYEKAERDGFKSLKGEYSLQKVEGEYLLPDGGVHTITYQKPGSDVKYVYTTTDLKRLEEVTCYRQGEKVYEAGFSQAQPSNMLDAVELLDVGRNETILFADVLEKDGGNILNWRDNNRMCDFETEDVLHHICVSDGQYKAGYWKQGGLWNSEWTKL